MIVYYSEYSMFVVGDDVPKWLPKWASQLKTMMSDLRLRNGNFPFQNRKGCELGLYNTIIMHRYGQFIDIFQWCCMVICIIGYPSYTCTLII